MFPEPGPSSASSPPPPVAPSPNLFLLPSAPPRPQPLLTSTQDLVTRFNLRPAYDKFVRPLAAPPPPSPTSPLAPQTPLTPFPPPEKGKGKERESGTPPPDGDDEDGKDGKKKKNSYKHLIKGIPGRHSMKKDDFLTTAISVPPKQHIPITPFDLKTQREAFSVSLEGLKGWNIHALVLESTQAREDRKKRKELKKLAKAHGGQPVPAAAAGTPLARGATPVPTPPARLSTPQPAQPPITQQHATAPRGVKREFEETGPGPGAPNMTGPMRTNVNGMGQGGARPGIPGVKPRPVKKQRMDMQGQARDMHLPMQQPTPQGI